MQALLIYDSEDSDAGETSIQSSTNVSVADSLQKSQESPCKEGTADVYPDNYRDVNTAAIVNKADYFGLEETSSEDGDTDQPKPKAKKAEHSYVQVQNKINMGGLEIELPDTHFWSKTSIDLQDQPIDNISQNANRDTPIISNLRNSYAHQRVHKYCADRKRKSTKDQSQSTTVGQSTESLAKRPIYHIHSKISPHLHGRSATREYRVPSAVSMALVGHSRVVNRVKWCCPNYSHLLLSASLDGSVKVWNCWSQLEPCVRTLTCHSKAVKDAEWDANGRNILSCSYDRTAALTDVDTGKQRRRFSCPGYVTCGKFHPVERDLVIVGSNNQVLCWDVRTAGEPVKTFSHKDRFGQVEDVIVTRDGGTVFGTGDLISRDSSDRNIMAWDFSSSVLLSNQIFQEKYACIRLKLHPTEPTFLAQTHGNYIAMFSTKRPYKLNKYCRFDGHKLMGYSIGFDMSPDGKLVCSGSGEGKLHFYNYHTGKHWRTLDTGWGVALDVAYHPVLYSTVACSGWNGRISVWS